MFSFQLDRDFLAKETSPIKRRAWLFWKVTGPQYAAGVFCLHHKRYVSIYNHVSSLCVGPYTRRPTTPLSSYVNISSVPLNHNTFLAGFFLLFRAVNFNHSWTWTNVVKRWHLKYLKKWKCHFNQRGDCYELNRAGQLWQNTIIILNDIEISND